MMKLFFRLYGGRDANKPNTKKNETYSNSLLEDPFSFSCYVLSACRILSSHVRVTRLCRRSLQKGVSPLNDFSLNAFEAAGPVYLLPPFFYCSDPSPIEFPLLMASGGVSPPQTEERPRQHGNNTGGPNARTSRSPSGAMNPFPLSCPSPGTMPKQPDNPLLTHQK